MLTLHFVGYGSTEKNLAAASNLWVVSQSKTHAAGRTVVAGMPLEVKEQKHAVYAHTHTHTHPPLIPLSTTVSQGAGHNLITLPKTNYKP